MTGSKLPSDERNLLKQPWTTRAEENPDWGFARTQRSVLMVPSVEWVQSVYSSQVWMGNKVFITPNRDYPYEGLYLYHSGANWKFIDSIAIAIKHQDGHYLPIHPVESEHSVQITPTWVSYSYRIPSDWVDEDLRTDIPFQVIYYLGSKNSPERTVGSVRLAFPNGLFHYGVRLVPVVRPFVDIRHMWESVFLADYQYKAENLGLAGANVAISAGNNGIQFAMPGASLLPLPAPETLQWWYKLGTGSRVEVYNPNINKTETRFISETKEVASFFQYELYSHLENNEATLYFECGMKKATRSISVPQMKRIIHQSIENDQQTMNTLLDKFQFDCPPEISRAILTRIWGAIKFKTYIPTETPARYTLIPHAGTGWFKTPWYRDVFEGIYNSFQTFMRLPEEQQHIKHIILHALADKDPVSGRILNRIPEYKGMQTSYENSDGTLLCMLVANEYIRRSQDIAFCRTVLPDLLQMIECFQQNPADQSDGPPRIHAGTGLLLSVPQHSWIDTRSQHIHIDGYDFEQLSNRVSKTFIAALFHQIDDQSALVEAMKMPAFFLPEINALWIKTLTETHASLAWILAQPAAAPEMQQYTHWLATIKNLSEQARHNFLPIFWNQEKDFLYNLVYQDGRLKDDIECESAVTCAGMLGTDVFDPERLSAIWSRTEALMLVERTLVALGDQRWPFGIVTRAEPPAPFYDDNQYHSRVTWPRSTPYLIKLLHLVGCDETVRQILMNNLDHQLSEGAVFYNQELFSLAIGNNPSPVASTVDNPVPVKNPIQFWSQWCDPYLDFFSKG